MENFYIGQIFENEYPADLATWCNEHEAKIELIQSSDNNEIFFEVLPAPRELYKIPDITAGDLITSIEDLAQEASNTTVNLEDLSIAFAELAQIISDMKGEQQNG